MADRKLNQNPNKTGQTVHYLYTIYIQIYLSGQNAIVERQGDEFAQQNSVPLWVFFPAYIYTHTCIYACCIHDIYRFPADRCALQVATAPINKSKCG